MVKKIKKTIKSKIKSLVSSDVVSQPQVKPWTGKEEVTKLINEAMLELNQLAIADPNFGYHPIFKSSMSKFRQALKLL
jgi:hypothetical protein